MDYNQMVFQDSQQMYQQSFRRFTKSEVYQYIQMLCYNQTGVVVTNMLKLEETPNVLRHSCFSTGVIFLPQYIQDVPTEYGSVQVPYYFCPKCGKLFVYNHVYD